MYTYILIVNYLISMFFFYYIKREKERHTFIIIIIKNVLMFHWNSHENFYHAFIF